MLGVPCGWGDKLDGVKVRQLLDTKAGSQKFSCFANTLPGVGFRNFEGSRDLVVIEVLYVQHSQDCPQGSGESVKAPFKFVFRDDAALEPAIAFVDFISLDAQRESSPFDDTEATVSENTESPT